MNALQEQYSPTPNRRDESEVVEGDEVVVNSMTNDSRHSTVALA